MTQANYTSRSRTPKNSVAGRPLPLRLNPEERHIIEEMAEKESRSASNMVRVIFLRGLESLLHVSTANKAE
ncbi:hypothetical protein ACTV70_000133 [Cronobacter dublinensis]